ncbi:DUF1830 domain-containing protein [Leptolyngbya sp. AN03gr2]|uniref:DUF1830 domain-containing protein n=1 Tax=unclassified Leptolyngbya TaxID=2650499 RepID=UPI003D311614
MNSHSSQVSLANLCCYTNSTRHIQIARIIDVPNWYFERVVFPGERLMFEAPQEAHLEIHTGAMASAILMDTIPCQQLRVRSWVPIA